MNQLEFVTLINPIKDKLFRIAKRLLISTEEAEDATQEVLLKLWNKKNGLNEYKSVEALAVMITKNYCLDQLKAKRSQNISLVHSNYSSNSPTLDKQMEDKDSLEWVNKIINRLPEQQRLIVQMREIENCEFEEIAIALDMQETAVRVALSRARKTIREAMLKMNTYDN